MKRLPASLGRAPDYSAAIGYDRPSVTPAKRLPIVGLSGTVLDAANASGRPDGIGIYTQALERALIDEGVTVCRVGNRRPSERSPSSEGCSIPYPLPWQPAIAAASALHANLPFASAIEDRIDVYHATDYLVPGLTRTPVVVTLHDAIPLAHPEWANPRGRRFKNHLLRRFARSAARCIAISHAAIPELVEHYAIEPALIRVVPLGVDAQWFEKPAAAAIDAVLSAWHLARGYFLHVGTLQPRKNVDRLVSAYERLPAEICARRQLVIAGKYGWGAAALRERLRSLRDAGRVVWLDYVESDTLRALHYGAHAFVFPSLAEGFGLPVLEALATGLPVISGDVPALREVAQGHATYVSSHDIDEISAAMATIDVDWGHRDAESRRSHARKFTWQRCARQTLEVYRELV